MDHLEDSSPAESKEMALALPLDTSQGIAPAHIDDNTAARIRFKKPRRVLAIVLTALCIIASFGCLIIFQVSAARYTVLGPVDSATGIRIEYTVSSRFAMARDRGDPDDKPRKDDAFPPLRFTLKPESPYAVWVDSHILRRPTAQAALLGGSEHSFTQTSSEHEEMSDWHVGPDGFVTIESNGQFRFFSLRSQDKQLVGGCPTTFVTEARDLVVNGHPILSCDLLIRPPGQSIIYIFETNELEGSPPGPYLKEIENLRNTIRVVKTR